MLGSFNHPIQLRVITTTSSLLVHASCLLPSTYFGPAQLAKHWYSLFSEEPGNAILANVLPVLQQLAHCILHVGKDMSLSCKQKRKSKEKWERLKKKFLPIPMRIHGSQGVISVLAGGRETQLAGHN